MPKRDPPGRDAPQHHVDRESRAVWVRLIPECLTDLALLRSYCLFTHGRMMRDDELLVYALAWLAGELESGSPFGDLNKGGPPW